MKLWTAAKAALRGKVVVINAYIKKEQKFQIDSPTAQRTRKRTN